MSVSMDRRRFLQTTTALGLASAGLSISAESALERPQAPGAVDIDLQGQLPYRGPNVVFIRFGGGVRRRETIQDAEHTYCPFIYHDLFKKHGVLFNNVEIEESPGVVTSHGEGTLYLLTGKYDRHADVSGRPLGDRFVAQVPTLFEYYRQKYDVPAHQALIINGEDRISEEFYTFSNHNLYGIRYRSTVLSLYRFKTYLLRNQIEQGRYHGAELDRKRRQLEGMENLDYRVENRALVAIPAIDDFWRAWREHYGDSGFVNPRGDRLLTTLTLWAMRLLRPRLMMINYQDPDYVHWGNPNFYTRAVSIIDEGVREIFQAVQADEFYRDNTVFVVVPDCGRDDNQAMHVPFQHHFQAHEIFAILAGPDHWIRQWSGRPGLIVDAKKQQIFTTSTIGRIMDFPTPHAAPETLLG